MQNTVARNPLLTRIIKPHEHPFGPSFSRNEKCLCYDLAMQRIALFVLLVLLAGACTPATDAPAQQSLTIYTGRDKDEVARVVDLFTTKFPKYKGNVNTITLGAQAALDRLRAEKS